MSDSSSGAADGDYLPGLGEEEDADDESTLAEQEADESAEDVQDELAGLEQDADMPLEDLMKMYGMDEHNPDDGSEMDSEEGESDDDEESESEKGDEACSPANDGVAPAGDLEIVGRSLSPKPGLSGSTVGSSCASSDLHTESADVECGRVSTVDVDAGDVAPVVDCNDDGQENNNCNSDVCELKYQMDLSNEIVGVPADVAPAAKKTAVGSPTSKDSIVEVSESKEPSELAVVSQDAKVDGGTGSNQVVNEEILPKAGHVHGYFSDLDDEEDDADYVPVNRWKKEIKVGDAFQANIPAFLGDSQTCGKADPEDEKDGDVSGKLLWNPECVKDEELISYLKTAQTVAPLAEAPSSEAPERLRVNSNGLVRDNELALQLLLQNNCDFSRALSSFRQSRPQESKVEAWTEEEKLAFKDGFSEHGKNFSLIKRNKLPQKEVSELVHFYYAWKKSAEYLRLKSIRLAERRLLPPAGPQHAYNPEFLNQHCMDHIAQGVPSDINCCQLPQRQFPQRYGFRSPASSSNMTSGTYPSVSTYPYQFGTIPNADPHHPSYGTQLQSQDSLRCGGGYSQQSSSSSSLPSSNLVHPNPYDAVGFGGEPSGPGNLGGADVGAIGPAMDSHRVSESVRADHSRHLPNAGGFPSLHADDLLSPRKDIVGNLGDATGAGVSSDIFNPFFPLGSGDGSHLFPPAPPANNLLYDPLHTSSGLTSSLPEDLFPGVALSDLLVDGSVLGRDNLDSLLISGFPATNVDFLTPPSDSQQSASTSFSQPTASTISDDIASGSAGMQEHHFLADFAGRGGSVSLPLYAPNDLFLHNNQQQQPLPPGFDGDSPAVLLGSAVPVLPVSDDNLLVGEAGYHQNLRRNLVSTASDVSSSTSAIIETAGVDDDGSVPFESTSLPGRLVADYPDPEESASSSREADFRLNDPHLDDFPEIPISEAGGLDEFVISSSTGGIGSSRAAMAERIPAAADVGSSSLASHSNPDSGTAASDSDVPVPPCLVEMPFAVSREDQSKCPSVFSGAGKTDFSHALHGARGRDDDCSTTPGISGSRIPTPLNSANLGPSTSYQRASPQRSGVSQSEPDLIDGLEAGAEEDLRNGPQEGHEISVNVPGSPSVKKNAAGEEYADDVARVEVAEFDYYDQLPESGDVMSSNSEVDVGNSSTVQFESPNNIVPEVSSSVNSSALPNISLRVSTGNLAHAVDQEERSRVELSSDDLPVTSFHDEDNDSADGDLIENQRANRGPGSPNDGAHRGTQRTLSYLERTLSSDDLPSTSADDGEFGPMNNGGLGRGDPVCPYVSIYSDPVGTSSQSVSSSYRSCDSSQNNGRRIRPPISQAHSCSSPIPGPWNDDDLIDPSFCSDADHISSSVSSSSGRANEGGSGKFKSNNGDGGSDSFCSSSTSSANHRYGKAVNGGASRKRHFENNMADDNHVDQYEEGRFLIDGLDVGGSDDFYSPSSGGVSCQASSSGAAPTLSGGNLESKRARLGLLSARSDAADSAPDCVNVDNDDLAPELLDDSCSPSLAEENDFGDAVNESFHEINDDYDGNGREFVQEDPEIGEDFPDVLQLPPADQNGIEDHLAEPQVEDLADEEIPQMMDNNNDDGHRAAGRDFDAPTPPDFSQ